MGFVIQCGKCGQSASAWSWLNPIHAIELPEAGFQCPHCKVIIQRRSVGVRKIFNPDGENFFIPESIDLVAVEQKNGLALHKGQVGASPAKIRQCQKRVSSRR